MRNANSMNASLVDVTDFSIVDDYTLQIEFNDHTKRVINFKPILSGPLFGPVRNLNLFNQVKLTSRYWHADLADRCRYRSNCIT
jgi:ABC-type oligopeptide transport system substrate-binding subunit